MITPIKLDSLSKRGLQVAGIWQPRNAGHGMRWDVLLTDGKYYDYNRLKRSLSRPRDRALIDSPVYHSRYQRVRAWHELVFFFHPGDLTPEYLAELDSAPSLEEKEASKYRRIDRAATDQAQWHVAPYSLHLPETYIIAVRGHQTGDVVTVTRRDGTTSTHRLGARLTGYTNLYLDGGETP
jgi:hypothetical protein